MPSIRLKNHSVSVLFLGVLVKFFVLVFKNHPPHPEGAESGLSHLSRIIVVRSPAIRLYPLLRQKAE